MVRTISPSAKAIARRLEAMLEALTPAAETDPATAFYALSLACHDAIDALDLPPISGGSPDDFEDLCPEFQSDPAGWPDHFESELDSVFYNLTPDHVGETPVEVLAADVPAFEPSTEDWADYHAWSVESDYRVRMGDLSHAVAMD